MPATLGGQWSIISAMLGVMGVVLWVGRRVMQYLELVTKTLLWVARQTGENVPGWLADQYKKVNGNSKASDQEIGAILGEEHIATKTES